MIGEPNVPKQREGREQKASGVVKRECVLVTSFYSLGHNYVYVGAFTRQTMPVKNNVAHSTHKSRICV